MTSFPKVAQIFCLIIGLRILLCGQVTAGTLTVADET